MYISIGFSLAYLVISISNKDHIKKILPTIITLLFIIIILRIKLFFILLMLCIFVGKSKKPLKPKQILSLFILGTLLYLSSMTIRWLGSLNTLNSEHIIEIIRTVWNAGIERELYSQYTKTFHYFINNDYLLGQTYIILINKFLYYFGLTNNIENPIYLYYKVTYSAVDSQNAIMKGSAHPTIYGDSFANFGWFGTVILPIIYTIIIYLSNKSLKKININNSLLIIGVLIFVILSIRGSVYYGYLYLILLSSFSLSIYFTKSLLRKL
ncbi:hypothetical protein [Photorhabdus hindustanensis]|uniref:Oligosaccharide repeat unit polymerase n=1 Tax=Photorhabdus hindustanensis TaxID=2918802 RepID=A0A2S8Q871_9GAMM|nr:hypothetical protein [Photorhabdus hindustanensis]PQQ29153.1 hypothetical protein C6H66_02435 [Photorhabdus hindustanensis]